MGSDAEKVKENHESFKFTSVVSTRGVIKYHQGYQGTERLKNSEYKFQITLFGFEKMTQIDQNKDRIK